MRRERARRRAAWRGPMVALLAALVGGCGDGDSAPAATATPTLSPAATSRPGATPAPPSSPTASATATSTATPPRPSPTATERPATPSPSPSPVPTETAVPSPSPTASAAAANPFLSDRVLNIAHRGGNVLAPEATLEAFRAAVGIGVDVLEMDLRGTADGGVVVIHDQTVTRTTDGSGRVAELTLAEIRALDAGFRFSRDGGQTFPFRGTGVRIPTFEEVLQEFGDQYLLVEIKVEGPSIVEAVVELLDRYGMRDRVVVASFNDLIISQFRSAAPDVLTAYSLGEAVSFAVLPPEAEPFYEPPAEFLQVPPAFNGISVLSEDFRSRAARFGIRIHVWDVSGEAQMRELVALGVDGLIVDDPATLERVLAER